MVELTEIDDVGPSRADDLQEAGYDEAEDVADADPDDLDGMFGTTSGDALVSNAQDATSLGDEVVDEVVEEVVEESEDEGADEDPAKTETHTLEPGFSTDQEHHLMAALVNQEISARQSNNAGRKEAAHDAIEQVRDGEPYEFTLEQLSLAYTGSNQLEAEYRGTRGLSPLVGEIRGVRDVFQNARQRNWPDSE